MHKMLITQELLDQIFPKKELLGSSGDSDSMDSSDSDSQLEEMIEKFKTTLKRDLKIHCDLDETLTTKEGATSLPFDAKTNYFMGLDKALEVLNGKQSFINQPLANILRKCLSQQIDLEIITNQILRPVVNAYVTAAGLEGVAIKTASPHCFRLNNNSKVSSFDRVLFMNLAKLDQLPSQEYLNRIKAIVDRYNQPMNILREDKSAHIVNQLKAYALSKVRDYFAYSDNVQEKALRNFEKIMLKVVCPFIDYVFIDDRDSNLYSVESALAHHLPLINVQCINPRKDGYLTKLANAISGHVTFSNPASTLLLKRERQRLFSSQPLEVQYPPKTDEDERHFLRSSL